LADVPANVLKALEIILVEHMDQVLNVALLPAEGSDALKLDAAPAEALMNLPPPAMIPVVDPLQVR